MVKLQLRACAPLDYLRTHLRIARTYFYTYFYNDHFSLSYAFDTLLEPLIWLVDNFTKVLGPCFVAAVLALNSSVVAIAYVVGLPYYWSKNPSLAVFLVIFGQFFFVNVVFHYWKAITLGPGVPPTSDSTRLPQIVSICKKCISPKPPRTHHCSVCDRCHLKMDHHCPWLNNCVGHFNHRHFFLYMVYTVAGCLFLMVFGFEILYEELFGEGRGLPEFETLPRKAVIIYEAFITSGCFLVLGFLALWHAKLITRGETSIEAHINASERKRMKALGKEYKNPYDFTPWYNWCLFLGMIEGRGWTAVLWPSLHTPKGNGLTFDTIYECNIQWNDYFHLPDRTEGIKLA